MPNLDNLIIVYQYSKRRGATLMSRSYTAALPIAHRALQVLIVLNWLLGAAILVLLVAMPTTRWILTEFGLSPSPEAERLVVGLHAIAVIGLVAIPLHFVILRRLLAIIETVRAGDPFLAANAIRLRAIAWALLALQVLSIVVGAVAKAISTPEHPLHFDAGFSISGWLAVLLTFVLARVFAEGSLMREDLERTV
ncbi:MAG TPA: DUF2975 domain-containing protein [Steroidobacteraceae bacterium]|nr:DUF2975 domain-containing protein [Steroidobacteraceae bacterium]